jgi:hypothetical protein
MHQRLSRTSRLVLTVCLKQTLSSLALVFALHVFKVNRTQLLASTTYPGSQS